MQGLYILRARLQFQRISKWSKNGQNGLNILCSLIHGHTGTFKLGGWLRSCKNYAMPNVWVLKSGSKCTQKSFTILNSIESLYFQWLLSAVWTFAWKITLILITGGGLGWAELDTPPACTLMLWIQPQTNGIKLLWNHFALKFTLNCNIYKVALALL